MKNIFLISDLHLFHANIIRYAKRPFNDVHHMNETLVENWNSVVSDDDWVICLGDFALTKAEVVEPVLDMLKGKKILVYGNHDHKSVIRSDRWVKVVERADFVYNGYNIHLKHHPFIEEEVLIDDNHVWIHGHTHGYKGIIFQNQIDASVENWNYKPVHIDDVLKYWENNADIRKQA